MKKNDKIKISETEKINPIENTEMEVELSPLDFINFAPLRGMSGEEKTVIKRENTASIVAIIIVLTFSILVIASLYLLFFKEGSEKIIDYVSIVLPPITTLIGMVFGFYFSETRLNKPS